jgi:uncharacterized RDD family membrane protein YckC
MTADNEPFAAPALDSAPRTASPEPGDDADRTARLLADAIDGALPPVFAVLASFLVIPIAVVLARAGVPVTATAPEVLGTALVVFIATRLGQWALLVRDGQTLGKRWMGIRVVTTAGEAAGFVRVLLVRTLLVGAMNLVIPCLWWIDAAAILLPGRRCLHDRLAGTRVITDAQPPTGAMEAGGPAS